MMLVVLEELYLPPSSRGDEKSIGDHKKIREMLEKKNI
jgi:hypothetical protein